MIALLTWMVASGDRSWVVGLVAAVVVVGLLFPVLVYVVHFRNSMGKFREMRDPVAEFVADDDMFTLSSDRGITTLKWNTVTELWRYDSLWLLLFSKAQFVTVPLDGVPDQMRSFVVERIKASGGKIAV
jgi:YcxB-like protein